MTEPTWAYDVGTDEWRVMVGPVLVLQVTGAALRRQPVAVRDLVRRHITAWLCR